MVLYANVVSNNQLNRRYTKLFQFIKYAMRCYVTVMVMDLVVKKKAYKSHEAESHL